MNNAKSFEQKIFLRKQLKQLHGNSNENIYDRTADNIYRVRCVHGIL